MQPIKLEVRGLGHVPSFKNMKRAILDNRTGRMRTLTEPKAKSWMERCIRSFEYQLLCEYQTKDGETPMVPCQLSWIASRLPADDSCKDFTKLQIEVLEVPKGEEGAEILIELLSAGGNPPIDLLPARGP